MEDKSNKEDSSWKKGPKRIKRTVDHGSSIYDRDKDLSMEEYEAIIESSFVKNGQFFICKNKLCNCGFKSTHRDDFIGHFEEIGVFGLERNKNINKVTESSIKDYSNRLENEKRNTRNNKHLSIDASGKPSTVIFATEFERIKFELNELLRDKVKVLFNGSELNEEEYLNMLEYSYIRLPDSFVCINDFCCCRQKFQSFDHFSKHFSDKEIFLFICSKCTASYGLLADCIVHTELCNTDIAFSDLVDEQENFRSNTPEPLIVSVSFSMPSDNEDDHNYLMNEDSTNKQRKWAARNEDEVGIWFKGKTIGFKEYHQLLDIGTLRDEKTREFVCVNDYCNCNFRHNNRTTFYNHFGSRKVFKYLCKKCGKTYTQFSIYKLHNDTIHLGLRRGDTF